MSIRIQSDQLAGTEASQTSKANEISPSSNSSSARTHGGGGGADHVEISSLSEGIAAANAAQEAQQAGRVNRLATLYASGRYHVDSSEVSRAIVSDALGETGGTE